MEEGDLPSEKVDKLGVLRPLSLPWAGWREDAGGRRQGGERRGIRETNKAGNESNVGSVTPDPLSGLEPPHQGPDNGSRHSP